MFEFLGSVRALGSGAINVASGVYSAVVSGAHTAYTDYTETGSLRSAATSGLSAAVNYSLTFTKEDLVQNALSFLKEKHEDHMLIELIESEIEDLLRGESKLFAVVNFVNAIAALHDLVTGATVSNYTYARYRVIYNTPPSFDDLKLLRELGLEDEVLDLVAKIELPPSGENIKIPKLGSINNAAWFFGYSIKNVEWLEELLTQGLRSAKSKAENILLNRGDDPKVNYVEFGIEQCAYAFISGVIQGTDQESQKEILSGLLEDIMKMISAESLPADLHAFLNEAEHRKDIIVLAQKILKALDNKDELIKAVISGDQARIAAASGDIIDVAAALLRNGIVNDAQHVVETGVVDTLLDTFVPRPHTEDMHNMIEQGKQILSIVAGNGSAIEIIARMLDNNKALLVDVATNKQDLIKDLISGDQARIAAASGDIIDVAAALLRNGIVNDAQHVVETGVVDTLLDTFVPRPHTEDMHNMIEQGKQILSIVAGNGSAIEIIARMLDNNKALLVDVATNKQDLIKDLISGDQARIAAASGDIIDVAAALLRNGIVNDAQHVVETGVVDTLLDTFVPRPHTEDMHNMIEQGKQILSIVAGNGSAIEIIARMLDNNKALLVDVATNKQDLIKDLISGDQARIAAASGDIIDVAAALLRNGIVNDAQHVVETGVVDTLLDTFVPRPHTEGMHNMIEQGKQILSIVAGNGSAIEIIARMLDNNRVLLVDIATNKQDLIKDLISSDQARIDAAREKLIDMSLDIVTELLRKNIVGDMHDLVETGVVDTLLDTFVPRPHTEGMHNMIEQGKQVVKALANNNPAVENLIEIFSDNHFTQGEGLVELRKMVKAILTLTTNTAHPDTLLEIDPANLAGLEIHSDFFQNEITRIVAKHGIKVLLSPAFGDNYNPETIKPMLVEMLDSSLVNADEREGFARFADLLLGAAGRITPEYMGKLQENVTSVLDSLFNVMGLCSPKKKNELTNTDFRIDHLMGELFNTVSSSLSIIEQLNKDEDFIRKIALEEDDVLAIDRALKSKEVVGKLAVDHTQDAVGMVKFCNFLLQQQKAKGSLNFIKLFKDLGSLLLDKNNSTVNAANLAERIVEHINTVTAGEISGDTKAAFNATMHYIAYFVSGSVADSGDKLTENFLEAEQGVFALIMQDPGRYLAKFLSLRTGGVMTLESQEAEALVKDPAVWQVALQSMRLCSLGSDQKMEKMKLTASIFKASMSSEVVRKMVFATSDQRVNALANPVIMMFALLIASIVLPHLAALLPFVNLTMALAAASPYAMATATVIMGASSSLYLVTKVQDIRQIYHYNNVGKDASTPIPAVVQPQAEKLVVASDANNKGGDIFKSVKDEEATQLEKNDADWILVGNDEACTMDEHRRRFDNSIKSAKLRSAATINRPIFSASVTTVSTAATIGVFASGVVIAPMLLVLLSSVAVGALIATVRDVACKNTCGEEVYMGKMKVEEFEAFARHKV
jgi:hypothetical protein